MLADLFSPFVVDGPQHVERVVWLAKGDLGAAECRCAFEWCCRLRCFFPTMWAAASMSWSEYEIERLFILGSLLLADAVRLTYVLLHLCHRASSCRLVPSTGT